MILLFLFTITCYLIGSIPTAYILGKLMKGIDIRDYGSGNVGATNVSRVIGKFPGIFVLLIDAGKGAIVVTLIGDQLLHFDTTLADNLSRIILGLAVVIGHNWMLFLKFKGGKGVATSAGVLIGLTSKVEGLRLIFWICLLVWILVVFLTRYVSLGSIIASISFPVLAVILNQPIEIMLFSSILCIFVIYKHRTNIKRLIRGEEEKFLSHLF